MDKFQQNENRGRSLFQSLVEQFKGITNAKPTTGQYNPIDYTFQFKDQQFGVEIKARPKEAESYSTYIMEFGKFNGIAKLINEKQIDKAYYVCFFGEDTAYMFNFHKIVEGIKSGKVYRGQKYMPKTTSGDTTMIQKWVLYLNPNMADKLVRIEGKWQKV